MIGNAETIGSEFRADFPIKSERRKNAGIDFAAGVCVPNLGSYAKCPVSENTFHSK